MSLTFLLFAALTLIGLAEARKERPPLLRPQDSPMNQTCLQTNCASAYQTCLDQPKCKQLLTCLEKCFQPPLPTSSSSSSSSPLKGEDSDMLACTNQCLLSYADFYFTGLSRCLTDSGCMNLPVIATPCRYPKYVVATRNYQISDLKGGWWVVRGYNKAYDCLACQHTFFDAVPYEESKFVFRPTFEALTANDSFRLINRSILVDLVNTNPGDPIKMDFYFYGIPMHLTWYALAGTVDNSTVLVYYCGDVMGSWEFEGAQILSRTPVVTTEMEVLFAGMVKANTNLDYQDFCKPQLTPCPN